MNAIDLSLRPTGAGLGAPAVRVTHDSPIGTLVLEGTDEVLTLIRLPRPDGSPYDGLPPCPGPGPAAVAAAAAQLDEYFAGRRREFDLPWTTVGTPFQREVWATLAEIPYGETASYAELAAMVGRPTAFRAVGQANGANPLPIVLPCHRVLASGGRIGGYGGGLPMKRALLALEGVTVP